MQTIATWLFVAAVYGTLAMPFVLAGVAWLTPPGRRVRRLLAVTGTWAAVCAVAGAGRLVTDDGYYTPHHVTFWAHSTDGERRAIVLLLVATVVASAAVFAFRAGRHLVTAVLVLTSGALLLGVFAGWLDGQRSTIALPALAAAVAAGTALAARGRWSVITVLTLVGGALGTTVVMLATTLALGLH